MAFYSEFDEFLIVLKRFFLLPLPIFHRACRRNSVPTKCRLPNDNPDFAVNIPVYIPRLLNFYDFVDMSKPPAVFPVQSPLL